PLLDGVGELRHLAWSAVLAGPRYLAQSILQQDRRALGKEGSVIINKQRLRIVVKLAILPRAFELRDFLFQSHPRNQIGHTLLNRQCGVAVWKFLRLHSNAGKKKYDPNPTLEDCASRFIPHYVL